MCHPARSLVLVLIAWFPLLAVPAAERARPNIVVVLSDDQGYGELSCHGNPVLKTPHLDRLHGQSIRLTDFHVAPMCTPTRGQLLTGVDALRNLAMNVSSGRALLRRDLPTMADLFAGAGYATGLFGKWHLGDSHPYRPVDRGFHESVWFPSSHIGAATDHWDNDYFDDTYRHNGVARAYEGYTTDVFFREAMTWMTGQAKAGRPFLCWLPTAAPHWPHFVPAAYREAMEARMAAASLPTLKPEDRAELTRYLAMITNLDDNIGRLDAFLHAQGLADNTIVVFLSDNGSTFGPRYFNAGMRAGKTTLWEGGHRVPCFIRWPGGTLRAPTDLGGLTQAQDLLPTLMELSGVPVPTHADFDGVSLAGALRGTAEVPPDRTLVVQFSRMNHPSPTAGDACVMWRRWRLIEDKALYDLASDPLQERDRIADHPEIAERLRAHYATWWAGVKDRRDEPQRLSLGSAAEPLTVLTPSEWRDVFLDQGVQVRAGLRRNGTWFIQVEQAGDYRFELRRWPRERPTAIRAGLPETAVTDGVFRAGVALPITSATIRIGAHERTVAVAPDAQAVELSLPLSAGPAELRATFSSHDGTEVCGAYYVYVERR